MTNREWLLNQMQNMSDEEFIKKVSIYEYVCNKKYVCREINCGSTKCIKKQIGWLKSEHKEPITLSEAERIILENIDKDYKWIARDKDLELYVYKNKTNKYYKKWRWVPEGTRSFRQFNHLFQFITWKDSEPYNIEELLKGE